jgi:hypothetical protein
MSSLFIKTTISKLFYLRNKAIIIIQYKLKKYKFYAFLRIFLGVVLWSGALGSIPKSLF